MSGLKGHVRAWLEGFYMSYRLSIKHLASYNLLEWVKGSSHQLHLSSDLRDSKVKLWGRLRCGVDSGNVPFDVPWNNASVSAEVTERDAATIGAAGDGQIVKLR